MTNLLRSPERCNQKVIVTLSCSAGSPGRPLVVVAWVSFLEALSAKSFERSRRRKDRKEISVGLSACWRRMRRAEKVKRQSCAPCGKHQEQHGMLTRSRGIRVVQLGFAQIVDEECRGPQAMITKNYRLSKRKKSEVIVTLSET